MKIEVAIELTKERITGRLGDGRVVFDEPAVVAIKPDTKGRPIIAGIGRDRPDRENTQLVAVVSGLQFDPDLAAAVALYVAVVARTHVRQGWRQCLMLIDRVEARVTVEGYERLSPEVQRRFTEALPAKKAIAWWVAGEKVKY